MAVQLLPLLLSLAVWRSAAASAGCARCPVCLVPRAGGGNDCLNASSRVRVHKDINGRGAGQVAVRHVWHCEAADAYFTHPPLSLQELNILYATYKGQADRTQALTRAVHQAQYVRHLVTRLPGDATIVEAGCSWGLLLASFAAPGRTLVCFEPGASFATGTASLLSRTNASRSLLVPSFFNATALELAQGIDLFLSSHVLEHISDLCSFLSVLFEKMNPGGYVFSEVPNHNHKYVRQYIGGTFHLTLPTPKSLVAYFYAAGFRLVDLQLADHWDAARGNGFHIRSVFQKPFLYPGANLTKYDNEGFFYTR
jgi:hypothetical protein